VSAIVRVVLDKSVERADVQEDCAVGFVERKSNGDNFNDKAGGGGGEL
jgi:hypothetical protein